MILRGNIQAENGIPPDARFPNTGRGVKSMLRFSPSLNDNGDPPYNYCASGLEGLSVENFRALAKYYGVTVKEPQGTDYNPVQDSQLKPLYRTALWFDLGVQ